MSFTLIIPTYNRPEFLGRLLVFLERQGARFPITVLDSSQAEARATNRSIIASTRLRVRHVEFDVTITPFEKFWRGAQLIETEFCGMCADDDLVLVRSIERIVDFLEKRPDYSVAHGWYFTFYLQTAMGITSVVYRNGTLEQDDPMERLHRFFTPYEAVTYGVFRARIMRDALQRVQPMQSIMARELLEGVLATIAGKVARLPVFYYGRALGDSAYYEHWHPIDFLITSPQALVDEYAKYRSIVADYWRVCGHRLESADALLKLIDLIHMRYGADYFKPRVMDYLVKETRRGSSRAAIMQGLWPILADGEPAKGVASLMKVAWLRKMRDRVAPNLRRHQVEKFLGTSNHVSTPAVTTSGKARNFEIYRDFVEAAGRDPTVGSSIEPLLNTLRAFE